MWLILIWLIASAGLIAWRWGRIHWLALGDTDDNMRLMEVRAWLNGQGWYDLRQYRLNPPQGFNIHWSRLVDIPIAGIILAVKPFFGTAIAERAAIAIAPLLPLGVALFGVALTTRRLVAPLSFALAAALLLTAQSTMGMFQPARIDHHGWQLAMMALLVAGIANPDRRRGGLLVGGASVLSLVIGFEMMPYLALAGAIMALFWVWEREEAARLQTYGVMLAGGSALGYALFASWDNAAPRCDVLSPVWMSTMVLTGALLTVLARLPLRGRLMRLGAGIVAAAIVGGFFILFWPQCLGRPEGVSPELQAKWLDNIREVKPVYRQEWKMMWAMLALPVIGAIGSLLSLWIHRRDQKRLMAWCGVATLCLVSLGMMFFQSRATAAAQLLAVPGGLALMWIALPWVRGQKNMLARVLGTPALFLVGSGLFIQLGIQAIPEKAEKPVYKKVNLAGARCSTIPSMAGLNTLPRATIMTMVDLGPRLITLTHHNAIAGPYHRNGEAILDMHHAFDGTPEAARAIAKKHGATLLMICPDFAEGTVYKARSPKGFYAQIEAGTVPAWLDPVTLPKGSPFKVWRVR
nr:AcrB/AcrD/AcrF family protein [Sphingobium boeckii]